MAVNPRLRELPDDVPPSQRAAQLRGLAEVVYAANLNGATASRPVIDLMEELAAIAAGRTSALPTPSVVPESPTVELSVAQVRVALGCSAQWVQHLARTGQVKARRAGQRAWLIDADDLDRYRHRPRRTAA